MVEYILFGSDTKSWNTSKIFSFNIFGIDVIINIKFFDPDQATDAAPTAYVGAVRFNGYALNVEVGHCNFVNSYIGIDTTGSGTHGCANIHDNVGYPLSNGILLARSDDSDRILNNHFIVNEYIGAGATLIAWVLANGIAINNTVRMDNPIIQGNFCYGYKSFIIIDYMISGLVSDNICDLPGTSTALGVFNCYGVTITGNQLVGSTTFLSNNELVITGNQFAGAADPLVYFQDTAGFTFTGNLVRGGSGNGLLTYGACPGFVIGSNRFRSITWSSIAITSVSTDFCIHDNSFVACGSGVLIPAGSTNDYTVHDNVGATHTFGDAPSATKIQRDNLA